MSMNPGGYHFRDPVTNWPIAVTAAGPWVPVKLFWTEGVAEVRQANPLAIPVRRHHIDHQDPYIFAEEVAWEVNEALAAAGINPHDKEALEALIAHTEEEIASKYVANVYKEFLLADEKEDAARSFFQTFIDGTFMQYADLWNQYPHGLVEELNEYASHTNPYDELIEKAAWAEAVAKVWYQDYRLVYPSLRNVRLIIGNIAIGNDWGPFNLQVGQTCVDWDAVWGYHPYVPTRNKQVGPGEWRYYSGRALTKVDEELTSAGIFVNYAFTEAGPIGYDPTPSGGIGSLSVEGGWRHPEVCDGDINAVKAIMEYWWEMAATTRPYAEGRIVGGPMLFDSGFNGWDYFQYRDESLMSIGAWSGSYVLPEPSWGGSPPPPDPDPLPIPIEFAQAVWDESIERQAISLNPDAALQQAIFADGYVPVSSEFWMASVVGSYACMPAEHLETGDRRVYMAKVPDWNTIWHIKESDLV